MPEDLQSLLDRIQKEGLEKTRIEAEQILAKARSEAEQIVRRAEQQAAELRTNAEVEAKNFAERARKSIEQAGRDVILTVGEAVQASFQALVRQEVARALTLENLAQMLAEVVRIYAETGNSGKLEALVAPALQNDLFQYFSQKYADLIKRGLEIKSDHGIVCGFRVRVGADGAEHDFSDAAIAEALSQLLRPRLAEIIRHAVRKNAGTDHPATDRGTQ